MTSPAAWLLNLKLQAHTSWGKCMGNGIKKKYWMMNQH